MPVSAFAGDPYAKQHGIETDENEDLPDFQKAMIQDAQTRTMEIKLDLESDTLGVQQAKVMPEVSEDSVRRILETVQEAPAEEPQDDLPEISSMRIDVDMPPKAVSDTVEFTDVSSFSEAVSYTHLDVYKRQPSLSKTACTSASSKPMVEIRRRS